MVSAGRSGKTRTTDNKGADDFCPFPWVIDLWFPFMVYVSRIGFIVFYPFMAPSPDLDYLSHADHMPLITPISTFPYLVMLGQVA